MAKTSVSYDPGRPQPANFDPATGTFLVKSWRGAGAYRVDLQASTCTCPDHTKRGGRRCKHLVNVAAQAEWLKAANRAARLTDEQLAFWLRHHTERGNAVVAGAIRVVRAERKAQQAQA